MQDIRTTLRWRASFWIPFVSALVGFAFVLFVLATILYEAGVVDISVAYFVFRIVMMILGVFLIVFSRICKQPSPQCAIAKLSGFGSYLAAPAVIMYPCTHNPSFLCCGRAPSLQTACAPTGAWRTWTVGGMCMGTGSTRWITPSHQPHNTIWH